jgi:hypothetical protein
MAYQLETKFGTEILRNKETITNSPFDVTLMLQIIIQKPQGLSHSNFGLLTYHNSLKSLRK